MIYILNHIVKQQAAGTLAKHQQPAILLCKDLYVWRFWWFIRGERPVFFDSRHFLFVRSFVSEYLFYFLVEVPTTVRILLWMAAAHPSKRSLQVASDRPFDPPANSIFMFMACFFFYRLFTFFPSFVNNFFQFDLFLMPNFLCFHHIFSFIYYARPFFRSGIALVLLRCIFFFMLFFFTLSQPIPCIFVEYAFYILHLYSIAITHFYPLYQNTFAFIT